MKLKSCAVFLLLAAGCLSSANAQDDVIKVNTALVIVPVIVSDRQGS
jgi:hypothetical protein